MLPEVAAAELRPARPERMREVLRLHATCVALHGQGVLLRGRSGAGKSDLALRLIDRGAVLVADDQVLIERRGAALAARAPDRLHGLIEVRGIGILRIAARAGAPVALVVELTPRRLIERLPPPVSCRLLGVARPLIRVDPEAPSAPAAVRLALAAERVG